MGVTTYETVIPAKAGIHEKNEKEDWIPAFAGMTEECVKMAGKYYA